MNSLLTQLEIAIQEGFTECFIFLDGTLYCTLNPSKRYLLADVEKFPCPCIITRTIVYRITTTDGIKGTAVLDFQESESN